PRAHELVSQDPMTQRVLATFMGAFTYALTAQVLLRTGLYEQASSTVILIVTIAVLALVVIAMLGWIEHLTRVGSIPDTVAGLEAAMRPAIEDWHRRPALGACPAPADAPLPAAARTAVRAPRSGYVQHIDIGALDALAAGADGAQVFVAAVIGSFVVDGDTLCLHSGQIDAEGLRAAFTIDRTRTFEQDVRFGVIVLSEIAQRALSPAVNDPGTAIFIIDRLTALLSGSSAEPEPPRCPRVFLPAVTGAELLTDGFDPIARDGAGMVEVQARLQRAFATLIRHGDAAVAAAAREASRRAAERAAIALPLEEDRARIRGLSAALREDTGAAAHSEMSSDESLDLCRRPGTRQSRDLASAFPEHQKRDAANAQPLRHGGEILGVDLGEPCPALQRPGGLGEFRRHHPARPAPWRPVVDDKRQLVAPRGLVVGGDVELGDLARHERIAAGAALRAIRKPPGRDAVRLTAGLADQFQGVGHMGLPVIFCLRNIFGGRPRLSRSVGSEQILFLAGHVDSQRLQPRLEVFREMRHPRQVILGRRRGRGRRRGHRLVELLGLEGAAADPGDCGQLRLLVVGHGG